MEAFSEFLHSMSLNQNDLTAHNGCSLLLEIPPLALSFKKGRKSKPEKEELDPFPGICQLNST